MSVSITRNIRIARSSAASSWCNPGGGSGGNAHNLRLLTTLQTTPRFRLSTSSIQQRQKHLSINTPSNNKWIMANNSLLLRCNARRLSSSSSSQTTSRTTAAAQQADNSTSLSSASITFGKIFFPSLCAITFTLGIWQTKRYFEKLDMVSKRKDDLMLDPMTFDEWKLKNDADAATSNSSNATTSSTSYRRVTLHGKFDHNNSILIGPRGPPPGALATSGPNSNMGGGSGMSSSQQGYWVVTPLIIGDERSNSGIDNAIGEGGEKKESGWLHRILFWKGRHDSSSSGSTLSSSTQSGTNSSITASSSSSSSNNNTSKTAAAATTVWINRGWIPRNFINQTNNQIIQSWDEPGNTVTLQTMESQTERGGGMFTPPSRLDSTKGGEKGASSNSSSIINDGRRSVRKLLWMDREAMEQMTGCNENQHPPLFVQINTEDNENNDNNHQPTTAAATTTAARRSYPVRPIQEYVGEFKVTPEVHAGYAVTWFGLSGAGVIMTRKLLTRGR